MSGKRKSSDELMAEARARARAWHHANKDRARATHTSYVERNRESVASYKLEWQRANRDAKKAALRAERLAWEAAHPEEVAAAKAAYAAKRKADQRRAKAKWALAHPEYHAAHKAKWVRENPELARARGHERRVAGGVRIDPDVARRLYATRVCFYCGVGLHNDYGRYYHPCKSTIDHVLPISRGGTNASENLVAACWTCNMSKNDKTLEEFQVYLAETGS